MKEELYDIVLEEIEDDEEDEGPTTVIIDVVDNGWIIKWYGLEDCEDHTEVFTSWRDVVERLGELVS